MKKMIFPLLYGTLSTVLVCLAVLVSFRNLSAAFKGTDLEQALSALKTASYEPPVLMVCAVGLLSGFLISALRSRKMKKRWIIPLGVLLLVIQCMTAFLGCQINQVCFKDAAESLLRVAAGKPVPAEFPAAEENYIQNLELSEESVCGEQWTVGFGSAEIIPEKMRTDPLYIAGYNNGWTTSRYLDNYQLEVYSSINEKRERRSWYDYAQARAVWIDAGNGGVLLIGIDGIALSGNYVQQIRERLSELCEKENCISVNVYSTHSHATPDTLGLWGPVGVDGKNTEYMKKLMDAAVDAAGQAIENRHSGKLFYGQAVTDGEYLLRDSRYPYVYDEALHQIRFESPDGFGLRMFLYGAHAESLRGDNTLLSRDFPGILCDLVSDATGDETIFLPGAIGGLIMTQVLVSPFDAKENLQLTGQILADYALAITEEAEREICPEMGFAKADISIPLDNNAFLYYQLLGILDCKIERADSRTGYAVLSEMSMLRLGDMALALIPGELFPELVSGERYGDASVENTNPIPLKEMADKYGVENLLVLGLANDELGYIVPPSDFLVNETNPYLERIEDARGEDHYEETNSVGMECALAIAQACEELLKAVYN